MGNQGSRFPNLSNFVEPPAFRRIMSSKISEMNAETGIQDLPDEMLERILLFLHDDDRRSALQVCRRWSTIIPMSSVKLVVNFAKNVGQEPNYHRTLLASSRQYKHLVFYFGKNSGKYELLVEIVQHFSHEVETLKIIPSFFVPIELMLISQMLSLCSNLRNLHIDSCKLHSSPQDLEITPMHKLEELYLASNLLKSIPNMMNIMPNITRLHMHMYRSEDALIFLRHFSSQLVELNIVVHSKDYFLRVCEMQFPLLQKLNFYCNDFEINPGGSFDEVKMIDLFFRQIPLLKEVTLNCELDDRVIQNLCRSCVNIQFLYVNMKSILQDCFRAICELKHLKHLRIVQATVDVPSDMYSPQTSLQELALFSTRIVHQAEFNSFVQRAFPNLAVMELLNLEVVNDTDEDFELHGHICSNIPSLQRLVIREPFYKITLDQLLEFCASHAPKYLRLQCPDIMDILENETPNRIPVQKLVLVYARISPIVLQKLISSMEELRWLELALDDNCSPEEISSLREQFPRCYIVANPSITRNTHRAAYQMLFG